MTADVLGLTTTAWRSFYEQQEAAIATTDVDYTTMEVPGDHRAFHDDVRRRTPVDYARFLPQVLRESLSGYDLVHANYGLTAPFAVAEPRLPVVVSLWGGEFVGNRYAPLVRAAVKRADAVIVPSTAMLDRVPEAVRDRTHVVPFPVDTEQFQPTPRDAAREAVGWDADATIVLFPYAESRYEKHFPLAERVVDGLPDDVELRSVANEPYEEMPTYLNAADALLVTSRWESGPMTVKEALACSLPVVSRPVGFVPEVLVEAENCRVAGTERGLRRALQEVLDDGGPATGRERIAAYDCAAMGERIRSIYDDVLDGSPGVPSATDAVESTGGDVASD